MLIRLSPFFITVPFESLLLPSMITGKLFLSSPFQLPDADDIGRDGIAKLFVVV